MSKNSNRDSHETCQQGELMKFFIYYKFLLFALSAFSNNWYC